MDMTVSAAAAGAAVRRPIEVITAEVQFYKRQAGEAILQIGHRLMEAKDQLSHGEWLTWLESEVDFTDRSAERFMQLAREYGANPTALANLGSTKALALLAVPAEDRADFIDRPHVVGANVKTVDDMTSRELEQAIKDRDAAIKDKEAAERIAELRTIAMETAEKAADNAIEAAEENVTRVEKELRRCQEERDRLLGEVDELRNAPIEAFETDQVMLDTMKNDAAEKARADAEALIQAKIKETDAMQAKLEARIAAETEARKAAEQALNNINTLREKEKRDHAENIANMHKQMDTTTGKSTSRFKAHFDIAQDAINKMLATLGTPEMLLPGNAVLRGRLADAIKTLCGQAIECCDGVGR